MPPSHVVPDNRKQEELEARTQSINEEDCVGYFFDDLTVIEDVDPQSWTGREIMDKWEFFKTNTIFKMISYLISAVMSLTVCITKSVQWSPFGLKLISLEAAKHQLAAVAPMAYGDDEIGSVREEVSNRFNFLTYKHFLAQSGMKITLPDKSDDECEFLNIEEADFLKRQSNFIPKIGARIGKLTEKSIFKSPRCKMKSKTETPVTVAISCVGTALHKWFAHGRKVYEDRRAKMQQVYEDLDLPIPAVHCSFDSRVQMWKDKYGTSDLDENNQL